MEHALKLYGFVKTVNGFWINPNLNCVIFKPYYNTEAWKVELVTHSFTIKTTDQLSKLIRAVRESWELTGLFNK